MKRSIMFIILSLFITNMAFSAVTGIEVTNNSGKRTHILTFDNPQMLSQSIPKDTRSAIEMFDAFIKDTQSLNHFSLDNSASGKLVVNILGLTFPTNVAGVTEGSNQDNRSCCSKFMSCLCCSANAASSVLFHGCKITDSDDENVTVEVEITKGGRCRCISENNCQPNDDLIDLTGKSSGFVVSNTANVEVELHTQILTEQKDDEIR